MARIGYIRTSSEGPSLDVQRKQLVDCEKLFEDDNRAESARQPHLKMCLEYLRARDILIVTGLARLGRSTHHLCSIAQTLKDKKVTLRVLDKNIDTSDERDKFLFYILTIIGPFETAIRAERQKDGIAKALSKGVRFGAKKKLNDVQVKELTMRRESGDTIKTLMKQYQLSKMSVYRYLKNP